MITDYLILYDGPAQPNLNYGISLFPQCLYTFIGNQDVGGVTCGKWHASYGVVDSYVYIPSSSVWEAGDSKTYSDHTQNIRFQGRAYTKYLLYDSKKGQTISEDNFVCARVQLESTAETSRKLDHTAFKFDSGVNPKHDLYFTNNLISPLVSHILSGFNRLFVGASNQFVVAAIDDDQWNNSKDSINANVFQGYCENDGERNHYIGSSNRKAPDTGSGKYTYTAPQQKTLISISAVGQRTTFDMGDSFIFDGTVTATYNDSTTADVTASCTFSGYDMSTPGDQAVTIRYSEGGIVKTFVYLILVHSVVIPPIANIEYVESVTGNLETWLKHNIKQDLHLPDDGIDYSCPNYSQMTKWSSQAVITNSPHFEYTNNMLVRQDDITINPFGDYVTNGLCLMLDGVNYNSDNELEWVDLVNSCKFVANGDAQKNSNGCGWHFSGNGWLDCGDNNNGFVPNITDTTNITVEVVASVSGWKSGLTWCELFTTDTNGSGSNTRGFCVTPTTKDGQYYVYYANRTIGGRGTSNYLFPFSFNVLRTMTFRCHNNTSETAFFNGTQIRDERRDGGYSSHQTTPPSMSIGRRYWNNAAGGWLIGDIYAIRVYNHPLTDEEVVHNQAIDIARYNIPMN